MRVMQESIAGGSFDSSAWLVVPIFVPLVTAILTYVIGNPSKNTASDRLGVIAAAGVLVSTCVITTGVCQFGVQSHSLGRWSTPLGIALRADGLTCVMLLMSAIVGGFVSVYAVGYFGQTDDCVKTESQRNANSSLFWPLWMLLWSALNGLFLSGDVFNLYVTLELLTLAAIGLIILAGTKLAVQASLRYLLVALAGSLFYLAGVALLYGEYGTLDIVSLRKRVGVSNASRAALLLMMIGLMLKSALLPFHFWLPPAHGSAPAPVSALLSALVVKASFYILFRLWFDLFSPDVSRPFVMLPATLGAAAIIWGGLQAINADRLKTMVAYSTVSQIGYLFILFALIRHGSDDGFPTWCGGILFAVSHAFAKASLFLAAGVIMHVAGHDRIADLSAAARRLPLTFFGIGIASISLMGLPPTASFVGKWMMIQAAIDSGQPALAIVILVGGLIAAVFLFRVIALAFTQTTEKKVSGTFCEELAPRVLCTKGTGHLFPAQCLEVPLRRAPRFTEQAVVGLAIVGLLLGLASAPAFSLLAIGSPWDVSTVTETGR